MNTASINETLEDNRCLYCKNIISESSREHVIYDSLGGRLTSIKVCCTSCNNFLGKDIDAKFVKMFDFIITRLPDWVRDDRKPVCDGLAINDGEMHDVQIKQDTVVNCKEYSKRNKCKIDSEDFTIWAYKFNIINDDFKDGLSKIAINFACENDVPHEILSDNISISKANGRLQKISFKSTIVPFVALSHVDNYIELKSELELYHHIILFNNHNELWCYVDLFNTFQFYILLSKKWDRPDIYKSYFQTLKKQNKRKLDLSIKDYGEAQLIACENNYDIRKAHQNGTFDYEIFKKGIISASEKQNYTQNAECFFLEKIHNFVRIVQVDEADPSIPNFSKEYKTNEIMREILHYLEKENKLNTNHFKIVTPDNELYIQHIIDLDRKIVEEYTHSKFRRLMDYIQS